MFRILMRPRLNSWRKEYGDKFFMKTNLTINVDALDGDDEDSQDDEEKSLKYGKTEEEKKPPKPTEMSFFQRVLYKIYI